MFAVIHRHHDDPRERPEARRAAPARVPRPRGPARPLRLTEGTDASVRQHDRNGRLGRGRHGPWARIVLGGWLATHSTYVSQRVSGRGYSVDSAGFSQLLQTKSKPAAAI